MHRTGRFCTALNADLLDNTPRGQELLMRTPMTASARRRKSSVRPVYLASDEASFVTGQVMVVDGDFLAQPV